MRKLLLCVLMITLPLAACAGAGRDNGPEEEALTIRGEYLSMTGCSGSAVITADYGQRVYRYTLSFTSGAEETVLTLTAPDTVAGLTARLPTGEGGLLEYDGAILETGPLDSEGLSPVSALPAILEAIRGGYLETCTREDWGNRSVLCLYIRDPELEPGEGRTCSLWLDRETHAPVRGEISRDGFCVIQCDISDFQFSSPSPPEAAEGESS